MPKSIGFAIVGTGAIASLHAEALARLESARLVACFDSAAERAVTFSEHYGGRPYEKLDKMLDDEAVTAVIVCTPSGAHLDSALAVIRSGRHVVVEKPLEITPKRCDLIIEAADKAGVLLSGIFPMRFADGAARMHDACHSGSFGTITLAGGSVPWYRDQDYYDQGAWRGTWALDGGGVLMNQAIHTVDLMQWFLGGVVEVGAFAGLLAHERLEVEDTLTATLRFESGALGGLVCTTGSYPGWAKRITVSGDSGSAILEDERLVLLETKQDETAEPRTDDATSGSERSGGSDPLAIGCEGHRRQLADVIAAIREDRRPLVDGREARKAVAIIDAVYRSVRERRFIHVSHV